MDYDLLIIGAGPAGYVAGIRAGQTGLKTAIIERGFLGGICLNWGCIPTNTMLESAKFFDRIKGAGEFGIDGVDNTKLAFNWKSAQGRTNRIISRLRKSIEILLQKNGVEIIKGDATLASATSVKVANRLIEAKNIIIATGSKPARKEYPMPAGILLEIGGLYALDTVPDKVAIIGQGQHAIEISQLLNLIGKEVSLIVPDDRILPGADTYLSNYALTRLQKDKIKVFLNSEITGHFEGGILLGEKKIACDKVINSNLRNAVIPKCEIPLELENGFIKVNAYLQTSIPNIFAIGDVTGKSYLAHPASAQGLHAVNFINGIKEKMDLSLCPMNIYSYPEIAQVGKTEDDLKASGINYKVSQFPLSANVKSMIRGHREGFVRLLSENKYGEILGVQIVAPNATDMISEALSIMQVEGTIYDMAKIIHAHPTVSEVFTEASLEAIDKAIHI